MIAAEEDERRNPELYEDGDYDTTYIAALDYIDWCPYCEGSGTDYTCDNILPCPVCGEIAA